MKTIQQHLKDLKPVHRDMALTNMEPKGMTQTEDCLSNALALAFDWGESEQGFNFWRGIYIDLLAGTYHFSAAESAERLATEEEMQKLDELVNKVTQAKANKAIFPEDDEERQKYAVGTFICEFFPHAIAELARFSYEMQKKHNPDSPMSWAKDKSVGDGNQIFRHQMDKEYRNVAWRGIEQLERYLCKMPPFDQ